MKKFYTFAAIAILTVGMHMSAQQAEDSGNKVYVKVGCSGNGASWENATGDLAQAVQTVSADGGTVFVGNGTYMLDATLSIPAGVSLVGDADNGKPLVTISGDGSILTLEEGSADKYASVTGFTISGASAGRGVTAKAYSRIIDCIIENNNVTAKDSGDAETYAADGNSGAGVWLGDNTLLERTVVRGNTTAYIVGGISIPSNNVIIKNCLITGNKSKGSMTGKANSVGGMLIWHNLSLEGIRVVNTTVTDNVGKSIGGAWMDATSKSEWINCVMWGNTKIDGTVSQLSVKNTHSFTNFYSQQKSGVITVTKVLDKSNTHVDGPNFTNPEEGDYTLTEASPLVDAGNNDAYGSGLDNDLCLGNTARLEGTSVDVGAYERLITSAIEDVLSVEGETEPEYFNLQGVKVSYGNMHPGEIYIMRCGASVRKIYK